MLPPPWRTMQRHWPQLPPPPQADEALVVLAEPGDQHVGRAHRLDVGHDVGVGAVLLGQVMEVGRLRPVRVADELQPKRSDHVMQAGKLIAKAVEFGGQHGRKVRARGGFLV